MNKNNLNVKKSLKAVIVTLLVLALFAPMASALPIPKGIEGRIYYLDGLSEVFPGIQVEIKNLDTGESIISVTGKGTSGRYSASIPWDNGANIKVIAGTPHNNVSRNITLQGVMRNVDLYLDITSDWQPPIIISEPVIVVNAPHTYEYEVVLSWIESNASFEIVNGPQGMSFNDNILTWNTHPSNTGTHSVKIRVVDRYGFFDEQEFLVEVLRPGQPARPTPPPRVGSRSISTGSTQIAASQGIEVEEFTGNEINVGKDSSPVKELVLEGRPNINIDVTSMNSPIQGVPRINRLGYSYLLIRPSEEVFSEARIIFGVKKDWLEERNVFPQEIVLAKFVGREWVDIPTTIHGSNGEEYLFEAVSPGLSFFAITILDSAKPSLPEARITLIKEPFVIFGELFPGFKIEEVPLLMIRNLGTGEEFTPEIRQFPGGILRYQATLHGSKGDVVSIKTGLNGREVYEEAILESSLLEKDLFLKADTRPGINRLFSSASEQGSFVLLGMIIIFILVILTIRRKGSRGEREGLR